MLSGRVMTDGTSMGLHGLVPANRSGRAEMRCRVSRELRRSAARVIKTTS
jgi:hypothetical protein